MEQWHKKYPGYFVIYHIPTVKCGATDDLEVRLRTYLWRNWDPELLAMMEVIDLVSYSCGDKFAGDVEWAWADYFGYRRGSHYTTRLNSEKRRKGIETMRRNGTLKESVRKRIETQRKKGIPFTTSESARKGAFTRWETRRLNGTLGEVARKGNETKRQNGTLTKCGQISTAIIYICPYCGETGQGPAMKRWHFDRCKHRLEKAA
jgi:hypothetical protein